jgi:hypothetical protein
MNNLGAGLPPVKGVFERVQLDGVAAGTGRADMTFGSLPLAIPRRAV